MNQLKLILIALIGLGSLCGFASAKVVNCYYGTWADYRKGDGKFGPTDIDPSLCTHLSYSFFGIKSSGEFSVLDSWLDFDLGLISRTIAFKLINPKLKVLAVVGGWNEGSEKYSKMAADPIKRKTFITTTLSFITLHGFNGLSLDWLYPAHREGGRFEDKTNFVTLLKELKAAFQPFNLELSIAVDPSEEKAITAYDIPNIAKYADYINVMTYDFVIATGGILGFTAPLRGQGPDNVETSINYWLQQGAPASKLVLGLAFFGRSFKLANNQLTAPGSQCSGPGSPGPFTREPGLMGYNEICSLVSSWSYNWANDHSVPYINNSDQWISYDNVPSIELKVEFINSLNLAGAMVYSIDTDDFRGKCGEKYPLLKAVNNKLVNQQGGGGGAEGQTTPKTTTTTLAPSLPPTQPEDNNCSTDGFYGYASDCSRYYQCTSGTRKDYQCNSGLYFDIVGLFCTWPNMAKCK